MGRKKKETFTTELEARKQDLMRRFADESPLIRDSLVKDLPAFNAVLNIHAESFEEIALRHLAKQQDIAYNPQKPPTPPCPFCHQTDTVGRKTGFMFRCKHCEKTFSATHESIASGTKCGALTWMKILQSLLNNVGITQTCEYCGISENTYYNIRNRLFYAISILLKDLRLYGNIEVDNTFVRVSYKGVNLQESEFPEDSIFFDDTFKPRAARDRGSAVPSSVKNANHICIFTGIDDRGHVLARFVGVGNISYLSLKHYIPSELFLSQVPQTDPFALAKKQRKDKKEPETKPLQKSKIIADREGAIQRYAQTLDVEFESHVYRKDGIQRRLSKDALGIQHVNALHRRLKTFLRMHGYMSSKYLPGFLTLFEFVENTRASQEAFAELFRIIACPGLGKPPSFFKDMFTVPNYLVEWLHSEHPLKKLPHNKLLAFYMMDIMKHPDMYPDEKITMAQIEEETQYTAPTIRKIYRELTDAGYRDLIIQYFSPSKKKKEAEKQGKKKAPAPTTINPTVLAIYDAYAEVCKIPQWKRPTFEQFLAEKNKELNTNYKRTNMMAKFKYIQNSGLRQPFEKRNKEVPRDLAFELLRAYEELRASYLEKGEPLPRVENMTAALGERYNMSAHTVKVYVSTARAYSSRQRELNAQSEATETLEAENQN